MISMEFDPEAAEALEALYTTDPRLADRVDTWLDRLEADPSQRAVRVHRFTHPPMWGITVATAQGADYAILWQLDGDTVVIRYIGPASFP